VEAVFPRRLTAGALLGILGCKGGGSVPSRIQLAATSQTVLDERPVPLHARLLSDRGEVLTEPRLSYSATPATVAEVDAGGQASCKSSGDASVLVAGGGQSSTMTLKCRLVNSITTPPSMRLIRGHAEPVDLRAMDRSGQRLGDVPLTVSPSMAGVVRYEDGSLVPLSVGNTIMNVSAGAASASFPVAVVELVESEPLAIADGATVTWALQAGVYQLDVEVKTVDGTPGGVTVSWLGAICPDAREAVHHEVTCIVLKTASLTIRNPSAFGLGASVTGFLNLYRAAP
jgi:hypothetical protein